jgi:hypothetical protein
VWRDPALMLSNHRRLQRQGGSDVTRAVRSGVPRAPTPNMVYFNSCGIFWKCCALNSHRTPPKLSNGVPRRLEERLEDRRTKLVINIPRPPQLGESSPDILRHVYA